MILTLCNQNETVRIEITPDHFERLRHPDISREEIAAIAVACHVDSAILIDYTADLKKSVQECIEIDASCDYTDHFS
jgi:hypothetical protein